MNLHITENYQLLKSEVTAHWKTGVVMTGVAVVVGRVYGKTAALGVVLMTVSNYQIIDRQIYVISWMSLRKTLIALVVFGNGYYNVIPPQIMSYIAVALLLIDNFQLSGINADLSTQNETLEKNNAKLKEAHEGLKTLEQELQKLLTPAAELQAAQEVNAQKAVALYEAIPERIQDIPSRLQNVNLLLKELLSSTDMQELRDFEADLNSKVSDMLRAFGEVFKELEAATKTTEKLGAKLETSVSKLEDRITLESRHIEVLRDVLQKVQNYPRRQR